MISRFVLLLALALRVVPVMQAAGAETLRIATYNLENYTTAGRLVGDDYLRDYPKPEAAKRALHAVIAGLGADILAVQEMGPAPYLEELQHDLAAIGLAYPFSYLVEAADPDRHIAILSRIRPKAVNCYAHIGLVSQGAKDLVKRGAAEVVVETDRGDLSLWVVHLKSRFTVKPSDPDSALQRAAESVAIRDLVLRRHPNPVSARFLIVGDFNDGKARRPVRAMESRGSRVIATLLDAADSRGERWTHFYRREETYERVDHILVSPALMPLVERSRYGDPIARIYDGDGVTRASDHRPVVVALQLRPLRMPADAATSVASE